MFSSSNYIKCDTIMMSSIFILVIPIILIEYYFIHLTPQGPRILITNYVITRCIRRHVFIENKSETNDIYNKPSWQIIHLLSKSSLPLEPQPYDTSFVAIHSSCITERQKFHIEVTQKRCLLTKLENRSAYSSCKN